MTLLEFFENGEWDFPFYKVLARNDSGDAPGHQGGMVLPVELRRFLPCLDDRVVSRDAPTTDRYLEAQLFHETSFVDEGSLRYQYQTWGGTRNPESRITDGLRALRERAHENDILVFQRNIFSTDHFRLVLVSQSSSEYAAIARMTNGHRWGLLFPDREPLDQTLLDIADNQQRVVETNDFQCIQQVTRTETGRMRIARSTVFRIRVKQEYGNTCAITGLRLSTPNMYEHEIESAHIVPIGIGGPDDVRNGMALSRTLHWAFDRGLFGVDENRQVFVPYRVAAVDGNSYLCQFQGRPIGEAENREFRVHDEAFRWHRANRVRRWM